MDTFKTADIVLASYLKSIGHSMIEIERQGNRGTFVFSGVPKSLIAEYDLGKALAEPRALSAEIRALTTAARR